MARLIWLAGRHEMRTDVKGQKGSRAEDIPQIKKTEQPDKHSFDLIWMTGNMSTGQTAVSL